VQLNYASYKDVFYGQGQKWTVCVDTPPTPQCGGVGQESFTTINWGVTWAF